MFKEPGAGIEAPKKVDLHGSNQAQIDEFVDSEIERLDNPSQHEALSPEKIRAIEHRMIAALLKVDASLVTYGSNGKWEIHTTTPDGQRTLYIDVEETDVSNYDGSVTLVLNGYSLTTWKEYTPSNKEEEWRKHVTFTASPERFRSIKQRQRDRENEQKRKDAERDTRRQELLPSVFAFARTHDGRRLSAAECEPIHEFIDEFVNGPLAPDAEVQFRLKEDSRGIPTCTLTTYQDGEVWDIAEFSER